MPAQFKINDLSKSCGLCSVHFSHSMPTFDLLTECAGQANLEHLAQNVRVFLSNPLGHCQVTKSLCLHFSWSLSSCFGFSRVQLWKLDCIRDWSSELRCILSKSLLISGSARHYPRLTMNWRRRIALDDFFQSGLLHIQITKLAMAAVSSMLRNRIS